MIYLLRMLALFFGMSKAAVTKEECQVVEAEAKEQAQTACRVGQPDRTKRFIN